ncbi:MAG: hypothetical protein NTW68_08870 [candidate division NC10 bacterium]|nr:hypothetical protein [candidate division NC10 bacterium]
MELTRLNGEIERAWASMHADRSPAAAYSDLKEFLHDAIALAERLGLRDERDRFKARLAEAKAVFRGQMSG